MELCPLCTLSFPLAWLHWSALWLFIWLSLTRLWPSEREDPFLFTFNLHYLAQCLALWDLHSLSSLWDSLWLSTLSLGCYSFCIREIRLEIIGFIYVKHFKYLGLLRLRGYYKIRIDLYKLVKLSKIGLCWQSLRHKWLFHFKDYNHD